MKIKVKFIYTIYDYSKRIHVSFVRFVEMLIPPAEGMRVRLKVFDGEVYFRISNVSWQEETFNKLEYCVANIDLDDEYYSRDKDKVKEVKFMFKRDENWNNSSDKLIAALAGEVDTGLH